MALSVEGRNFHTWSVYWERGQDWSWPGPGLVLGMTQRERRARASAERGLKLGSESWLSPPAAACTILPVYGLQQRLSPREKGWLQGVFGVWCMAGRERKEFDWIQRSESNHISGMQL